MKIAVTTVLALTALACANAVAAPAAAKPIDCRALMPAALLSSLTGGTFTLIGSSIVPASGGSGCEYAGSAVADVPGNPGATKQRPDVDISVVGAATGPLAKMAAKSYAHISAGASAGQLVAGLGDKAVERSGYIAVLTHGKLLLVLGNKHLSDDQLRGVATAIVPKLN